MLRNKIWLINILLALGTAMIGGEIHGLWHGRGPEAFDPENAAAAPAKSGTAGEDGLLKDLKDLRARIGPKNAYDAVAEKNLFSADRKGRVLEEPGSAAKPAEKPEKPAGQPVPVKLFGIIVTQRYKAALISNPYAENPANPNKWLKTGESVGGGASGDKITVAEIHEDHVVVTIGERSEELHLYKKNQEVVATVMKSGAAAPPDGDSGEDDRQQKNRSPQDHIQISPDGKYKIIETPFGKIKRRIR